MNIYITGMNRLFCKNNRGRGFTIIELVVGATIFLLLLGGGLGVLVYSLRVQRKLLQKQQALGEIGLFDMEYMSRALRMAKKQSTGGTCLGAGVTYENPLEDVSAIKFINHMQDDACQEFFLSEGALMYDMDAGDGNRDDAFRLTSYKVDIDRLQFHIQQGVEKRSRVTIVIEFTGEGLSDTLTLQTTVSQRNLNVE